MLGSLCARYAAITKPSSLRRHSLHYRSSSFSSSPSLFLSPAVAIWNSLLPSLGGLFAPRPPGEGSWNVSWDVRPARWLHHPDSAWLLFGVCGFVEPIECEGDFDRAVGEAVVPGGDRIEVDDVKAAEGEVVVEEKPSDYRVTGVLADGRCLFRAIAHSACFRKGIEAPDDNRQRELADELRAQVVEELIRRREETEWFIEGDFDAYIKQIQEPYVWGGEPELLMASHVLKTPICVYMVESSSGSLANIAKYGDEYCKGEEAPINILFHGYGHYDILESVPEHRLAA